MSPAQDSREELESRLWRLHLDRRDVDAILGAADRYAGQCVLEAIDHIRADRQARAAAAAQQAVDYITSVAEASLTRGTR